MDSCGTYSGEMKDGIPNGEGIKMYYIDMIYEGEWVNGAKHGHGKVEVFGLKICGIYEKGVLVKINELTEITGNMSNSEINLFEMPKVKNEIMKRINSYSKTTFNGKNYEEAVCEFDDSESEMEFGIKEFGLLSEENKLGEIVTEDSLIEKKLFLDGELYYEGQVKNGKMHGKGVQYHPDAIASGEFKNDKFDGKIMIITGKHKYEGDAVCGVFHGKGVITAPDYTYEGEFAFGRMNGYGKRTFDGYTVEGNFENDKPKGIMKIKGLPYFDVYEGEINKKNMFHGRGTLTYPSGYRIQGRFINMELQKDRVIHYISKLILEGRINENQKHVGIGKLVYRDEGFIINHDKTEKLFPYIEDKTYLEYENSKRNLDISLWARIEFASGTYKGEVIKGKFQGKGKVLFNNGESYEGQWVENKMHGTGKYIYKDKQVYLGGFHDNKREGFGQLIFPDGTIIKGQWENDKLNGIGRLIKASKTYEIFWKDNEVSNYFICTSLNGSCLLELKN